MAQHVYINLLHSSCTVDPLTEQWVHGQSSLPEYKAEVDLLPTVEITLKKLIKLILLPMVLFCSILLQPAIVGVYS